MKVSFKEFQKNTNKYMQEAKNEPVIIKKLTGSYAVVISYEIYTTLLEGAWAENALQYSDKETKEKAKKEFEKKLAKKNEKKK